MSITQEILAKTNRLIVQPEITPGCDNFSMFNDAGTEVEVSEWLYAMVKMIKPDLVLETGTHVGVSSTYIAKALQDNNRGRLITFEIIDEHYASAPLLFADVGVTHLIDHHKLDAQKFDPTGLSFDILFLDSEPNLRFDEFLKFWPFLRDGGFIIIHDLNESIGHSDNVHNGMYDWPYGDFRDKIGSFILSHQVQTIAFPTPRGLTMFQKTAAGFCATQLLTGQI